MRHETEKQMQSRKKLDKMEKKMQPRKELDKTGGSCEQSEDFKIDHADVKQECHEDGEEYDVTPRYMKSSDGSIIGRKISDGFEYPRRTSAFVTKPPDSERSNKWVPKESYYRNTTPSSMNPELKRAKKPRKGTYQGQSRELNSNSLQGYQNEDPVSSKQKFLRSERHRTSTIAPAQIFSTSKNSPARISPRRRLSPSKKTPRLTDRIRPRHLTVQNARRLTNIIMRARQRSPPFFQTRVASQGSSSQESGRFLDQRNIIAPDGSSFDVSRKGKGLAETEVRFDESYGGDDYYDGDDHDGVDHDGDYDDGDEHDGGYDDGFLEQSLIPIYKMRKNFGITQDSDIPSKISRRDQETEHWQAERHLTTSNRKALRAKRAVKCFQNNTNRSFVDSSTQTYQTNVFGVKADPRHRSGIRNFGVDEIRQVSEMFSDFNDGPSQMLNMARRTGSAESEFQWRPSPSDSTRVTPKPFSFGKSGKGWPKNELAVELFEQVIRDLSRADVLNLRLVSKEFEKKISKSVFQTVVVPFRAQIYRNLATDHCHQDPLNSTIDSKKSKGKEKARDTPDNEGLYGVPHNVKDVVYDGMKVFQAWGSHIRKFAMTFDINQDILQKLPTKGVYEEIQTFWGSYSWPNRHYTRYQSCEDQEKRADETRLMTAALSHLTQVTELGLFVDNGLGWINGPDVSDRAKIFQDKASIFGSSYPPSEKERLQRAHAWDALTKHIGFDTIQHYYNAQNPILIPEQNSRTLYDFLRILYPDFIIPKLPMYSRKFPPLVFGGIDLERDSILSPRDRDMATASNTTASRNKGASLVPRALEPAQKEWLLENYWAQLAFLTSWSIAVVDNAATFRNVRTLTIAHLSSKYLHTLSRQDMWTTLENLNSLVLMVSPDWRDVMIDGQGLIQSFDVRPSQANADFYEFLRSSISGANKITKLTIGYVGGGERALGMFARNKNVLPAPVMNFGSTSITVLMLPHVQHLTFANCWISPNALKKFSIRMSAHKLETLILDSVSLSAEFQTIPTMEMPGPYQIFPGPPVRSPPSYLGFNIPPVSKETMRQLLFVRGVDTTILDDPSAPDTEPPSWVTDDPISGSWPEADILKKKPLAPSRLAPHQIQFNSCGYVRLRYARVIDESNIGAVYDCSVFALERRFLELQNVMMSSHKDPLLGQISPTIEYEEACCLVSAFGMTLGWPDDDIAKYHTREDGQPMGGYGRFSGILKLSDEVSEE